MMQLMMRLRFFTCLFVLLTGILPGYAYDWAEEGERLHYDVRFWGIKAGDAELLFRPLDDDQYRIVGRAWTGDFSSFVNITDRWSVFGHGLKERAMVSDRYVVRLNENDYRAHKEVNFDHLNNIATYQNVHAHLAPQEFKMIEDSRDTASALYYLRHKIKKISVGDEYVLPVFNLDTPYTMRLRVLGEKVIDTEFGDRRTFHIVPVYVDQFNTEKRSRWNFWVSDDGKNLPLRIKVKLKFGSFEANLLGYGSLGRESAAPDYLPEIGPFKQRKKEYSYANPLDD